MLAGAVLPLATAYTVTEAFALEKSVAHLPRGPRLPRPLHRTDRPRRALPRHQRVQPLLVTQILNGLLLIINLIINDPEVMGGHTNSRLYNAVAWTTVAFVVLLSTVYLILTILGLFGVTIG